MLSINSKVLKFFTWVVLALGVGLGSTVYLALAAQPQVFPTYQETSPPVLAKDLQDIDVRYPECDLNTWACQFGQFFKPLSQLIDINPVMGTIVMLAMLATMAYLVRYIAHKAASRLTGNDHTPPSVNNEDISRSLRELESNLESLIRMTFATLEGRLEDCNQNIIAATTRKHYIRIEDVKFYVHASCGLAFFRLMRSVRKQKEELFESRKNSSQLKDLVTSLIQEVYYVITCEMMGIRTPRGQLHEVVDDLFKNMFKDLTIAIVEHVSNYNGGNISVFYAGLESSMQRIMQGYELKILEIRWHES